MWNNWQYRLLALFMALICWYVVSGQEKVETWLEVPLEFVNLPPQMEITSGLVNKIQVRIRGTSNQVRALSAGHLAYKLDLGSIEVGTNIIPLLPENMAITSAVEVVEITPSRLELTADIVVSKRVPVHLDWARQTGDDVVFQNATVVPTHVVVTGFTSNLEKVDNVSTERIHLSEKGEPSRSGRAKLLLPKGVRCAVSAVDYSLQFTLATQEIWVKAKLEPTEYDTFTYTFASKTGRLRLEIPLRLLKDKTWRDALHLMVDPGARPANGVVKARLVPIVPDGVRVLEVKPQDLDVRVRYNQTIP